MPHDIEKLKAASAVEIRDPKSLRVHASLRKQPGEWSDEDPRFLALVDDINVRGIDQPLLITADGAIADGRHRWRGANRLQLAGVPCKVIDESEVAAAIVNSLLQRRHYTKSQRAYLSLPHLEQAFAEAKVRSLANLQKGSAGPDRRSAPVGKCLDDWALEIGVCVRFLTDARKVMELFKDTAKRTLTDKDGNTEKGVTFREFFEPRILADEDGGGHKPTAYGLGAVISGIQSILESEKKGKPHKGGKPDETGDQLRLFNQVVTDELNRWEYWTNFDDDTKAEHFKTVRAHAAKIKDPARLEGLAAYHRKLANEFEKAAKEAKAATADHN